ncbi:MAG TPA: hypothetical protein DEV93_05910 [Chloroflexi bacterium]|nr:hypothetical protein [Chloroflexota bacterium]
MGRPKEHDERTAVKLLETAERIAEEEGPEELSVRRVAGGAGTTTRAVYSLFSSKDGLVVALGVRAFDLLGTAVDGVSRTDDPVSDLVEAGLIFRRFALEHPALFRIGIQRIDVSGQLARGFHGAADHALSGLHERVRRVDEVGRLGNRAVPAAAWEFHALCEGLAALELRCTVPKTEAERLWRDGLSSLVEGWCAP